MMTAIQALGISMMSADHFAVVLATAESAEREAYASYKVTSGTFPWHSGVHAIGHGSWVSGFKGQAEWLAASRHVGELKAARGLEQTRACGWRLIGVCPEDGAAEYVFGWQRLDPILTHGLVSREELPANPGVLVAMVQERAKGAGK